MKFEKSHFFLKKKEKLHFTALIIGTILIMAFMIITILSNTNQLEKRLEVYAENYSENTADQLKERIVDKIYQRIQDNYTLAEYFSKMPGSIFTEELILKKQKDLNMNQLFIINSDGIFFPKQDKILGLQEYLMNEKGIYEQTHISFLEENKVIISTPFYRKGKVNLLVSICSGKSLHEMIEDFNYQGKGRCCIINQKGKLIIAPSDMKPFQKFVATLNPENITEEQKETLSIMIEDIQQGKSGWRIFKNAENQEVIIGYKFLYVCDWMLLTILPRNLFSNTVHTYITQFIFIALALILVTIYFIFSITYVYNKNMRRIQTVALKDVLTKGDNEVAFRMKAEDLLRNLPEEKYVIVYLNNKDFKSYNMRFGVKGADKILVDIYHIMKENLSDEELVARCDGASFVLLLECASEGHLIERVKKITDTIINKLYTTYGIEHYNILKGAYLIPKETYDFMNMQDWAKIASGFSSAEDVCQIFDNSIIKHMLRKQEIVDSFKQAIVNHEFELYIQPKICLQESKVAGGEILVRWNHPKYGFLFPNEFIPLFEKNGKIKALDFYMFKEACKLLSEWKKKGSIVPLSVNLSRAHLRSRNLDFLDYFKEYKEKYGIQDGWIEIELTESIMLEEQEVPYVLETMERIKEMGLLCSLDDFGYGYSSLTLLKDISVDTIKLDRQFFLKETDKAWIVVKKLIQMAHALKISVVAEGIEEQAQVDRLRKYECDLVQGYVYAKPMKVSQFIELCEKGVNYRVW